MLIDTNWFGPDFAYVPSEYSVNRIFHRGLFPVRFGKGSDKKCGDGNHVFLVFKGDINLFSFFNKMIEKVNETLRFLRNDILNIFEMSFANDFCLIFSQKAPIACMVLKYLGDFSRRRSHRFLCHSKNRKHSFHNLHISIPRSNLIGSGLSIHRGCTWSKAPTGRR